MILNVEGSDLYTIYSLPDSNFYLPFSEYKTSCEFRRALLAMDLHPHSGPNIYDQVSFGEAPPEQGWKLHVSAVPADAVQVLQRVAEVCREFDTTFKFVKDERLLLNVNGKAWPRSGSGKFITIYPSSDTYGSIAGRLSSTLHEFEGPYILTDRPVLGSHCLFTRYGGFRGEPTVRPDGTLQHFILDPSSGEYRIDSRRPYAPSPSRAGISVGPKGGLAIGPDCRYEVQRPLHFSSTGGIYLATDLTTGERVLIKEGRRRVAIDRHGRDAADRAEAEFGILSALKGSDVAPEPYELFHQGGNTFLVEELVGGRDLAVEVAVTSPLNQRQREDYHDGRRYLSEVFHVWRQIFDLFKVLEEHSIRYPDISTRNVMIQRDDTIEGVQLRLIDFESAEMWRMGADFVPDGTRGFRRVPPAEPAYDGPIDPVAMSYLLAATIYPVTQLAELDYPAFWMVTGNALRDLGASSRVQEALEAGTRGELTLRELECSVLGSFADHPIAKALPRNHHRSQPDSDVTDFVQRLRAGLLANLELESDQMWPVDPKGYERNNICAAWGSAGIVSALSYSGGCPPEGRSRFVRQVRENDLRLVPGGLYSGTAGISWTLLDLGETSLASRLLDHAMSAVSTDDTSVYSGMAGVGIACLHFYDQSGQSDYLTAALDLANACSQDC